MMARLPVLVAAALLAALTACNWEKEKLSEPDFMKLACEIVDRFNDLSATNCARISDPTLRDACFLRLNGDLLTLTASKLNAVIHYRNCDEKKLNAVLGTLTSVIDAAVQTYGNMVNPLQKLETQASGKKQGQDGATITIKLDAGAFVDLQAGSKPTGPLQLSGSYDLDLVASGGGYAGAVTNLLWTATLPSVASWTLFAVPTAANSYQVAPVTSGFAGTLSAVLFIQGPGVQWCASVTLPLAVSQDLSTWTVSTGSGLVPAGPFFPLASAQSYDLGSGCSGVSGLTPVMTAASVARIGDPLLVVLSDLAPSAAAVLVLGDSSTVYQGVPLPIDLSPYGAPGCFLRVSPLVLLPADADGRGFAQLSVPIPLDPSLPGAFAYLQAFGVDAANALGLVASNGLQLPIFAR